MKAQMGEWMYSSTLSFTLVLDGGGWSMPHSGWQRDLVPIVQEAGCIKLLY
jgi:hypothetical protein